MMWWLLGFPALFSVMFWACCRMGARADQTVEAWGEQPSAEPPKGAIEDYYDYRRELTSVIPPTPPGAA